MFIHSVMIRLTAQADAAFHHQVQLYCQRIRAECSGVQDYWYGRNEADRHGGFEYAVVGLFASSADHDAYQVSAAHQAMKAYMSPFIVELLVLDSRLDQTLAPSPEMTAS
ncbi:MAG: Dabb family protein [Gammaproteobacteria bacterium]